MKLFGKSLPRITFQVLVGKVSPSLSIAMSATVDGIPSKEIEADVYWYGSMF